MDRIERIIEDDIAKFAIKIVNYSIATINEWFSLSSSSSSEECDSVLLFRSKPKKFRQRRLEQF